ncbi:MAG: AbgT family transporter [Synergistaceae bacterium]|nr:AbgT family transporter [Synergistaceae bacterium]
MAASERHSSRHSSTGASGGFLGWVERVGNKLPNPFMLFTVLAVLVLVLSFVLNKMGVSVTYMAASAKAGAGLTETTVTVRNLLEAGYFREVLKNFVKTYTDFAPLGTVMVAMIGIGYVQDTGFFDAFMRKTLLRCPPYLITFVIALVGVCANISSNAGIIISTTLAAAIYASLGRNPILGAVLGYVTGHGGFTANLLITADDVLQSSITKSAADAAGIAAPINPLMNWYFLIAATFVIATIATLVTEFVMPRYIETKGKIDSNVLASEGLTPAQENGLKLALKYFLVFIVLILIGTVPSGGILRNAEGNFLPTSPLTEGIVPILVFLFFFVGTGYGLGAKVITSQHQIPKLMSGGLRDSLIYFVICFPAAYFISFFGASRLSVILSVKGAELLEHFNFTGIPLAVSFILLVTFLNLFLTSGSAKWMILAPIFVPMFASVGFAPALTQIAYRIGDTSTNPIAPINYFIPIIIGIMERYKDSDEEIGFGNVISLTLPYSICYLIFLTGLLVLWMHFDLPLGPGASLWMPGV